MNLTLKKCVPCEGGTQPMKPEEALELQEQVKGWRLLKNTSTAKLRKTLRESFT